MNRYGKRCWLVLLPALATACGEGAVDGWAGTETDSAGVTIVVNPDRGLWGEEVPWTLEEELRIGTPAGDPEYQFGQVGARGIVEAADGRILVLDAMGQHVRVFSEAGEYLSTFGGAGSGPGEIGPGASFLIAGSGDTLLVPDLANQRTNLYTAQGESLGSFPMRLDEGIPFLWDAADGQVVTQMRQIALPGGPEPDGTDRIVAMAPDGSVTDTLTTFPSGGTLALGGDSPEIKFFAPEPSWALGDGMRIVYGVTDEYRIQLRGPDGSVERIIVMPFETRLVDEEARRLVLHFMEQAWQDAGVPAQAMPQLRSIVQFAEVYPAFARVQFGPRGTIWVQKVQPVSDMSAEARAAYNVLEDSGSADWDVFDPDGRFLGTIAMPYRFTPRVFSGDRIYGVARDELDVQYVVRLRILTE